MSSKSKNNASASATFRTLRRETRTNEANPVGYFDAAGTPLPNSGNEQAPYSWVAPFQESPHMWLDDEQLPIAHAFSVIVADDSLLAPIEVADYRVISVYIRYQPEVEGGILSIIPLSGAIDADPADASLWTPLSLAGPNITTVSALGSASPFDQPFSSRLIQGVELRTAPAGAGLETIVISADFEVASYEQFRISLADVGTLEADEAGTVTVRYSRRV